MTTIAVKDGVMAADSQATSSYIARVKKIHRLPDGTLVGGCGTMAKIWVAIQWLSGEQNDDPPEIGDCHMIFLRPNGTIWLAEEIWPPYPLKDKHLAIGSGGAVAQAAMLCGASAVEALKVACKLDDGTSGPVHSLKLR